jgi:acyl carrier protein
MDILTKVSQIIKDKIDLDEDFVIEMSTTLEQLGADSMDLVETVMDIEEQFDITVPEGAEEKLYTVGDVVRLIEKLK